MFNYSDDHTGKSRRGFAAMSRTQQRDIASKGGRAAHAKGTAYEWDTQTAREAGKKGGRSKRKASDLNAL